MQTININPELLKNKEIAQEAILKLINTKKELDSFIDTLELLSSSKFRRELHDGLREYKKGETTETSIEELEKEITR